mgnify:CR=1 FL=1
MKRRALPKGETPTFELIDKLQQEGRVVAHELRELSVSTTTVNKKIKYVRLKLMWNRKWRPTRDYEPILDKAYTMLSSNESEEPADEKATSSIPNVIE